MPKPRENRRKTQHRRKRRLVDQQRREDEVKSLFTQSTHFRRDCRRASELITNDLVDETTGVALYKQMMILALQYKKLRPKISAMNSFMKVAATVQRDEKLRLDAEKLRIDAQLKLFPTSPVRPTEETDEPMTVAFLEEQVTPKELAETLKVLMDAGIAETMVEEFRDEAS